MSNAVTPRIDPLPPGEWDDAVLDALGAFPAGLKFVLKSRAEGDELPRGTNVLGALARHPALARSFLTFNAYIATATQLPPRIRELVILRMSWLQHSEYEFAQHLILGKRVGLSEVELERIQDKPSPGDWTDEDFAVLLAIDELHADSCISDATWQRLSLRFQEQQLMDLLFMAGCYSTLAMVLNSIKLPLEPGAPALDADTRTRLYRKRT